jgi:hypothetical protein
MAEGVANCVDALAAIKRRSTSSDWSAWTGCRALARDWQGDEPLRQQMIAAREVCQ